MKLNCQKIFWLGYLKVFQRKSFQKDMYMIICNFHAISVRTTPLLGVTRGFHGFRRSNHRNSEILDFKNLGNQQWWGSGLNLLQHIGALVHLVVVVASDLVICAVGKVGGHELEVLVRQLQQAVELLLLFLGPLGDSSIHWSETGSNFQLVIYTTGAN
ncbi:Hypothetical_protein [Hexamita inflata]|uniref:Hypothetical_protein n=1 Tax=Hexamita inflata TaxID=28002 RepID=A0AA86R4E8_9EUKA|nr:Hypothetical protein HINF_LOCUS54491 [Hexamita inflata]